ncbi:MAG TPA: CheR family methyltransferase [Noviherbaspirillum sp.]|nr:CheR family methyltransferase [Noviherbaspirillum sp.]
MKSIECIQAPDLLDRLAERVEAETGLAFRGTKRRDLRSALKRMAEAAGFGKDEEACAAWLLEGRWSGEKGKERADLCALHLTVAETYFFREPRAFDLVCDYARKKLALHGANTQLRIWSAGCCTGEEPYSIAMVLRHGVPDLAPRRISILATDLNRRNLQIARAGVYRQWSFRNTYKGMQKLNFSEEGENQFRIHEQLRECVKFSELNLASADYPSAATDTQSMDIIFCRNVLMYFSRQQAQKVIARFRQCLVEGGWLIVSPCEASAELFDGFAGHYFPDAVYYQKAAQGHPVALDLCRMPLTPTVEPPPSPPARRAPARLKPDDANKSSTLPVRDETGADPIARARAYANEGAIDEAMLCLDHALKDGKPTAELYQARALIAMEAGDRRSAIDSLKRVVYLKPDSILAHYLMGVLQSEQNRGAEAARQFRVANELLAALDDDDMVPGSDGLHAAYLRESMRAYLQKGRS